jgi:hypothetical protein
VTYSYLSAPSLNQSTSTLVTNVYSEQLPAAPSQMTTLLEATRIRRIPMIELTVNLNNVSPHAAATHPNTR